MTLMDPTVSHLHTYFLFPFAVDKEKVLADHPEPWINTRHWTDGLDRWIAAHDGGVVAKHLGKWERSAYTRFDMDSAAYQDMVFFHPFVRRIFFDTIGHQGAAHQESLLRCYRIPVSGARAEKEQATCPDTRVRLEAEDVRGRSAETVVTDLRLFLFANGIGILSIGVEALNIPATDALWINEMMRKVYPSSGRQRREARIPSRMALCVAGQTVLATTFENFAMSAFLPPLSPLITGLLYFLRYDREEFEPVLDERMIVYSYAAIDPGSVPPGFVQTEDYQIVLSRFLYVDRTGRDYRYEPEFTRAQMREHVYRRWAHQGTYYGFTSYSNISMALGTFDCDDHLLREGFLIHRMFETRYYLMGIIALFYRATLLDFAEKTAVVSKRFWRDQEDGRLSRENIDAAVTLRADFLHFSNYWHFDELANKDEEIEHFLLQCRAYRISPMKTEIEAEVEKLNSFLTEFYQRRNTEAVNRLAVISMILGGGAVLTGFFGMNFGKEFASIFFEPTAGRETPHYISIAAVAMLAFGSLLAAFWVLGVNWEDYREIFRSREARARKRAGSDTGGDEGASVP
jgi:hypothetical protein